MTVEQNEREVEKLLADITAKLRADQATVARSLGHGRITWRRDGAYGKFEVKLELSL